jgi:HNH endonuclease
VEGAAGARNDPSEADTGPLEVAENDRTSLYPFQGATSSDSHRDSGRFQPSDEAARFWAQVDHTDTCWMWQGHRDRDGYGRFKVTILPGHYRTVRAHRWAWEAVNGPVPAGLTLDHLCGRPACVRPDHLDPCTNAENLRRRHARRRTEGTAQ